MSNKHEKPSIEKEFVKAMEEVLESHEGVLEKLKESEILDKVIKTFPGN